jgi:hypothetical protein
MQLFHWYSDALKNYARGNILVMAADVEQARALVREEARKWLLENKEWWFAADGSVQPEDAEDHDEWWAKLEADIAVMAGVDPVRLIAGGE